ncbi:MAG: hypothetical protein IPO91_23350 [Chloroflexi bacterium]|nr:hypothetical protein [Chloroflexota bacterium]
MITLIISTVVSLFSLIVNLYQATQPIDIRDPITIQIVPITPIVEEETAVPEALPTRDAVIDPEATLDLNSR